MNILIPQDDAVEALAVVLRACLQTLVVERDEDLKRRLLA